MEHNPIHHAFQNSSRFSTILFHAFMSQVLHDSLTLEEVSSQLITEVLQIFHELSLPTEHGPYPR